MAAGAGLIATGIIVIAACAPYPMGYVGAPDRPKVAIVGDSISDYARATLDYVLGQNELVNVQSRPAKKMSEMLDALQLQLTNSHGSPDVVVEELGTNEALFHDMNYAVTFAKMLGMLLTAQPAPTCVVLVNIGRGATLFPYYAPPGIRDGINAAIQAAVAAYPFMHEYDLDAAMYGPQAAGLLQPDGLHLTASADMSDTTTGAYRFATDLAKLIRDPSGCNIPEIGATTTTTSIPSTTVPETTVPETTVPETTVPETTVPDPTTSTTTEPSTTTTAPETTTTVMETTSTTEAP